MLYGVEEHTFSKSKVLSSSYILLTDEDSGFKSCFLLKRKIKCERGVKEDYQTKTFSLM